MENKQKGKFNLSIAIVLGCLILGGFYSYTQHEKNVSSEKHELMKLEVEKARLEKERVEVEMATKARLEKEERDAEIKTMCSVHLERNGNYLVSNETLNTNYNACLHSNGL